ncbi:MAG TPA: AAA family ATPase, partial [Candidatus Nitrosotalea sp.]|nr:AAA family ATPase [Candidatus Nitrosotalea sp.]
AEADRPGHAAEPALLPFVGRRDEMERLLESWSRAARGRGACAFVGGESGIGKSRLVTEFARNVEDRGGRVLVGTTSSPEAVPYECIVDALRSALPLLASLRPTVALASVAALLPELHARLSLPDVPRLAGDGERIRLFESLFRSIADLAKPRPLLMILEDLQWAQAGSLELLQFLLRRIAGAPVMIVVTYRDEETARLDALHRLRRDVRAGGGALNLWLSRLSATEVEELRARLPGIGEHSAQRLLDASQGNPLFISQLVADAGENERGSLPGSLQNVVERRIERLSERARTAAEIAASAGDRFSRDIVREVSAWDESELNEAFDELLDRRIIREAGGRGFLEYAFSHQLMLETIARAVPAKHAGVRRRRVARVFEELYPERFSELSPLIAGHYEAGGDVTNATRCYLEAVRRSTTIGALAEARTLCRRALAIVTDPASRAQLLLESAVIESRSGDLRSRDAAIAELERADESLGDPAVHRSALLHRIDYAVAAGDNATLERAVGALRDSIVTDDPQSQAVMHLEEARLASALGRLNEAYDAADAALKCSRALDDDAGMARAFSVMAQIAAHRGPLDDAAALFDEAAKAAARAADPVLQLLAINSGWTVAYQRRDIRHCRELGETALELAVKLGDRPSEAHAHSRLGTAFAYEGATLAEARRQFAEAAKIYAEAGNPAGSGGQFMNRAVLEMRAGFAERALTATHQAVELFERANDVRGRIGALSNLAYVYAFTGQADEARRHGLKALEIAREHGFNMLEASTLENLAAAEGAAGEYARAIEYARTSLELRSRNKSQVWWGNTLADIALWEAALGNLPAARAAVELLLSDEDAISRGSDWPEYCYWAAARIFHLEGRPAEARRALERARHVMLQAANELEPEDREAYMAIPFHVALRRAAENGVWPN